LGVPVVPASASKGKGIKEVIEKALHLAASKADVKKEHSRNFDDKIETRLDETERIVSNIADLKGYNARWVALKLIEGDENIKEKIKVPQTVMSELSACKETLEKEYDSDIETVLADNRYQHISKIVNKTVKKTIVSGGLTISDKIDRVVTNRILAIPLFMAIMFVIFQITFGAIGSFTIDTVDVFVNGTLAGAISGWLEAAGASVWLHALIIDGILAGMGSMLVFVPQIMLLFLFLALLEDTGYMARAAFIMDRLLRKLGLSGKSFIPMLLGFGCSVPAVMAARTLENEKDRRLTIILTPFMSCGARLPVYALFAAAFFAKNQGAIIFSIYVLGMVVAILSGVLLKNTILKGEASPFVMELPPYRIPTIKGLTIHMLDRGKGFIKKAGTVIFAASVIIWFLQSYNLSLQMVDDPANSIFGAIGMAIAPIFAPLGFGDWKSAVALLTGLVAKEVVVSTLGILHGVGDDSTQLVTLLQTAYTPLIAYAFMAFTLLYVPCIAAVAAIKREMNSWKWTMIAVGYQLIVAWTVSFLIYQIGRLFGLI
jgi:ferrous iron transport protein B